MNRKNLMVLMLLTGLFSSGCSMFSEMSKKNDSSSHSQGTGSNQIQNADSNSPIENSNSDNPVADFRERTNRRKRIDVDPSATPVPPNFKSAPEDSEAAVTMDPSGAVMEIRVFKSHPQLTKVEAIRLNETEKTLKIYLRNGEIKEVKTDKIDRLETMPTADILKAVGIPFEPAGAGRSRLAGQK